MTLESIVFNREQLEKINTDEVFKTAVRILTKAGYPPTHNSPSERIVLLERRKNWFHTCEVRVYYDIAEWGAWAYLSVSSCDCDVFRKIAKDIFQTILREQPAS